MKKTILVHLITGLMADKKLKKHLLVFALGIFSLGVMASPKMVSKEQIGMFKNSKTCVVIESTSIPYDVYIKDAVMKYWKSTEFEFIDQQEFEKRRFDSKYSFLLLMKGIYDKDPGGVSYNFISLVLGDPAANDITNMPELCSIPISYFNDNDTDYGYVIPAIVKFMQQHAKNLEKKRFLISLNGLKYYNGSSDFKDKVLLLNKDKMASNASTLEKIKTVYPSYVKLISTSEIETELSANPANTLFNFHVGPAQNTGAGKCFEMIFDVEGKLYYYNYRKITNDNEDGFNLKDFNRIR
jgi:hypothetical protein